MKDVLTYKEFIGVVHFSSKDDMFYGKIEGVNDLVTFEGKSVSELKNSFKEAVEDYIELCKKVNKEPNGPPCPTTKIVSSLYFSNNR